VHAGERNTGPELRGRGAKKSDREASLDNATLEGLEWNIFEHRGHGHVTHVGQRTHARHGSWTSAIPAQPHSSVQDDGRPGTARRRPTAITACGPQLPKC